MQRFATILLAMFGMFFLLVLGLVGYVQIRDSVAEGDLQRAAEPRLFFGEGTSSVTLTQQGQQNVTCPASQQTTNIILLLDKSGSMEGEAFSAAIAAARQFIQSVDLTTAYVSIAFFDNGSQLAQAPTQDEEALIRALAGFTADGDTNIYEALDSAANTLLNESPVGNTTVPVIILLSDGGAGESQSAVSQLGQQLKDNGFRIVTIALGDADADFLETLSTNPGDHYLAPDPTELQTIYVGLAEEINDAIAVDITVQEHVNPALTILPDSLSPTGSINDNIITWELPSMSAEATQFSYQAAATGIGYHSINEEITSMAFTHCLTGPTTNTLAAGPSILSLPPLPLLLLVLLPLLLLPLFLMAWFRRSKDPKPEPRVGPVKSVESGPPADNNPAWIKQLDNHDILTAASTPANADELTPTVIIGIGTVGRVVLSQAAQTLKARHGGRIPAQVRLLQIDVQPQEGRGDALTRPAYLEPEEWVLLEPDLAEVKRLLQRAPEDWPHLRWYKPWDSSGRMQGRMGVFYDLRNGAKTSILWNSLSRAAHRLERPKLRLVGATFDDASSGMLVDIARLMQIITNRDVDVEFWLSGPVGVDWSPQLTNPRRKIRKDEQQARTLATLRELERFQRNARVPFHYVPETNLQDQLRDDTQFAVVQTLLLFEPPAKAGTVDDHLAAIADGLLAIIHTPAQQAFNDHLSASQHIANRLTNERGIGTVCSLGAYSVRMPLGPMEEALTWRLVYDLLFERELGLLPLLEMQPDGAYKEIEAEEITADNARERKAEATRLVDKYISRLNRADFGQAVARKISRLLNGEEGKHDNPLVNRIGGLLQAERWLGSLKSVVRREGEREVGHSIGLLAEQTTEWQTFLDESVRPFIANQWGQSRQQLAQFSAQHGRHWALTPELEWPIYKQRLRPTPKQTAELQRAAQRFGWYVHYHESSREWRIHLLAPPGDFVWANGAYIEQFSLERDRDAFVRHLYNLVYPLVHNKTESEYALDEADLLPVKQWLADAKPRLSVNELEASHFIETNEAIILVAPKSERATALKQKIQNVWQQSRIILCETQDKTAVTLLHLRDRVPLTAYEGYNEEAWQMNFVDSNLYVWQGEQIAAEIEPEPGRIDSAFRGWIEQDKQRLDLFGQAIIYGVLGNNKGEWELPGWGTWRGDGLGGAVANLFSADTTLWPKPLASPNRRAVQQSMDELAAAIAERRREIRENPEMGERAYLRQTQKELIDPLLNGKDVREQYLALYMQQMMQDRL